MAQPPNEIVFADVATVKPAYGTRDVVVKAEGMVTYDTRFISTISSRVAGRLEHTSLKYPYQAVRRGDKVAEIYSAELVTAQRELIYLHSSDPSSVDLLQGAKQKLHLYGMSEQQVESLLRSHEVTYRFPVYSPVEGYVVSLTEMAPSVSGDALASPSAGQMGDMESRSPSQAAPSTLSDKSELMQEGDYIQRGQGLFKIVSDKALRIELNLPAALGSWIKKGGKVQLDFNNEHPHSATVDFIQPFFDEGEQFLKVRVYTIDMKNMHIGHLVDAAIHVGQQEALWIPRSSVVDLGAEKVVFTKSKNTFRPVTVRTGISNGDVVQVVGGITSQDEIAANAQFLVDGESFIKR
jgi:membrane fusion protein, copper/silver efflux system